MRALPALLVLTAPVLAGCIGGDSNPLGDGTKLPFQLAPIPAFPIEEDHDHADSDLHLESANLPPVGYASGFGDGTSGAIPAGQGFSELFVRDHLAFLGRRGGAEGGFLIFDVADPAHPQRLGEWDGLANYDMESTYDNKFVFFVSQYLNNQQPGSIQPDPHYLPRGVFVVDVSNPASPSLASYFPVPTRGAHTITYHRTEAGRELVAAMTYDFLPDPSLNPPVPGQPGVPVQQIGVNPLSQRVLLLELKRTPTPHLELLSTYERHDLPPGTPPDFKVHYLPHDASIQWHPLAKKLIMYVAYWDLGAILVDITDPTNPTEMSVLADFSPSKVASVHLAAPSPDLIDGRHITITEPEFDGKPETGQYTLFDTTDPKNPVRLGYWTLPGGLVQAAGTLRFSPHNFDIDHGYLYLAHYHAGVWVVDISTAAKQAAPEAVAFVQPTGDRPDYKGDIPNVWTALYDNGHVYASDIATGLHVYHFAGDALAPASEGAPHQR